MSRRPRMYANINVERPPDYSDYERLSINWGN